MEHEVFLVSNRPEKADDGYTALKVVENLHVDFKRGCGHDSIGIVCADQVLDEIHDVFANLNRVLLTNMVVCHGGNLV